MKTLATALFASLLLATPALADEPPAFDRSYEAGVQVYRGYVPQTDLQPYLALQARERQAAAARADRQRFEREHIRAIEAQTAQLARLERSLARSGPTVVVNNDRDGLFGRNDFLFGSLAAVGVNNRFGGRRGFRGRGYGGNGFGGSGIVQRDAIPFDGARRFDRRGFNGRRNGLVARGNVFGATGGSGQPRH